MKGGGASLVESFGCVGMGHVPQIGQFGLRLVASVKSVLCPKGKCPKGNPLEWLSCQRTPDQSHILNLAGEQSNPALIRLSMGRSRPDLSQIFQTWPWPGSSIDPVQEVWLGHWQVWPWFLYVEYCLQFPSNFFENRIISLGLKMRIYQCIYCYRT
jgi:hypothetical protein